jgi:DedD protein
MRATADANLDELKKKARRRLVGAIVLALAAAVFVPMLLETDERPLGDDVSVRIPAVDQGKFVNRLNTPPPGAKAAATTPPAPAKVPAKSKEADNGTSGDTPPPAALADKAAGTSVPETPASDAGKDAAPPVSASPAAAPVATAETPVKAPAPPPADAGKLAAAKPVAERPPKAAASAPVKTHGFDVQLAAFSDDKGANALVNRLKKSGYDAFTEPVSTPKGTLWRVRVGPFASRDDANATRDKLKREGQNGIVAARTA